ncbi:MAG: hypothetical protein M3Z35_05485 [Nitrospirota bacterium]|nr:hypothetical protein [Nitrospirota bacterium]
MTYVTRSNIFSAIVVAATSLASLPAAAQPSRPDLPPPPDRPYERQAQDNFTQPTAGGTVKQYLMNPHGDVDGLLLGDGTQVHFPPHMGNELTTEIKLGNQVTVQGDRLEGTPLVRAEAITNSRTGRAVVEHEPSWKDRPIPPHLKRLSMKDMQASGSIQALLYAPRGEIRGFILADGTQIHMRPDVGDSLARTLTAGETVQAEGYGTDNQYGRSLEATAIGLGGGRLVPLDRSVRQLSGPDEPPPPRRR